jgi:hypothetical protein
MNSPVKRTTALVFLSGSLACGTSYAAVIADLRQDYDTPSSAHTNGQSAAGRLPDTLGSGNWNFLTRSSVALGGAQTEMVYFTSANGVRNANAYADPGGSFDLPGLSNSQLISGGSEGAPAGDELALHPGDSSDPQPFLVVRWTSGMAGTVDVSGAIRDLGILVDGISFQIINQSGTTLFNSVTTSGNTPVDFSFSTTVASGNFIDFVVGRNGNYFSDQSALKIAINSTVPEPSAAVLGLLGTGLLARRRR